MVGPLWSIEYSCSDYDLHHVLFCFSPGEQQQQLPTPPVKKEAGVVDTKVVVVAAAAAGQLKAATAAATAVSSPKLSPLKAPVSPTTFPKVRLLYT